MKNHFYAFGRIASLPLFFTLIGFMAFCHTSNAQCDPPADFNWTASGCTVTFQALNAVIAANAAITTTGQPDGNEKQLNDLYLKKAAKNQWTLDATDMALLEGIAYQCPEQGGPAVYWARSWYAALTNTPINPFDCLESRKDAIAPNAMDEGFKVFPNPASGQVWVVCPITEGAMREISLIDNTGRQLLKRQIGVNEATVKLKTSTIPAGLYVLRITGEGKTIHTQRVAIVK